MTIDDEHKGSYLVMLPDGQVTRGWSVGWELFRKVGTPKSPSQLEYPSALPHTRTLVANGPLDLAGLWPDTKDYDQNTPGIIERAKDLDRRRYRTWLEKAFWLNATRVPICASYLAGCAKVGPGSILELGTGGDSAHSTGVFLYYIEGLPSGSLFSVDRHPLSHAWLRYRHSSNWTFMQADSLAALEWFSKTNMRFGMIFIDSSHEYEPTLAELKMASRMTDALLLDDSTHPGVKQALNEWLPANPDWLRLDLHSAVTLLERHPYE